jgi:hypothetical protein
MGIDVEAFAQRHAGVEDCGSHEPSPQQRGPVIRLRLSDLYKTTSRAPNEGLLQVDPNGDAAGLMAGGGCIQ